MLDFQMVSVEKNELFRVFRNGYIYIAKFTPTITTYGGSLFYNEVGTCYCHQIRYLIVNGAFTGNETTEK